MLSIGWRVYYIGVLCGLYCTTVMFAACLLMSAGSGAMLAFVFGVAGVCVRPALTRNHSIGFSSPTVGTFDSGTLHGGHTTGHMPECHVFVNQGDCVGAQGAHVRVHALRT